MNQRLKLLYLADIRFPLERANGIQTMEACHAAASFGHDVTLLVRADTRRPSRDPFDFYDLSPIETLHVCQVQVWGTHQMRRVGYLLHVIFRVIACEDYDAILTRDLGVASILLRLPGKKIPPVIYESHNFDPLVAESLSSVVSGGRAASEAKRRRLLAREERVWCQADGYISTTQGLYTELIKRFGHRQRAVVIPNGVRIPAERAFVSPKESSDPLLVYAGHLYPWKGVDVIVHSLQFLSKVRLVIVGGVPSEDDLGRLQELARALGVQKRITFTGLVPRKRVPSLLADGDVLVLPTLAVGSLGNYTSPLKLFEYMASGKPIVASNIPAIREVLTDEHNAVLVEPGDGEALGRGIKRVISDQGFAGRIARRAFDEATNYSWSQRAEQVMDLLTAVVQDRHRQN